MLYPAPAPVAGYVPAVAENEEELAIQRALAADIEERAGVKQAQEAVSKRFE